MSHADLLRLGMSGWCLPGNRAITLSGAGSGAYRLARLQAIDLAVLTEVVRLDQRGPSFEITEWSVKCLSNNGAMNPDGLWLISGNGRVGNTTRLWSSWGHFTSQPPKLLDKVRESLRVKHYAWSVYK
jgi:hypothetical protein